jgi:hypothetical protein
MLESAAIGATELEIHTRVADGAESAIALETAGCVSLWSQARGSERIKSV